VANFEATTGRKPRATARRSVLTVGGVHATFEADEAMADDLEQLITETDVSGAKDAASARKILSDAVARLTADPARLSRFAGLARAIRLAEEGGAAFGIFARAVDRDDMVVTIRDNDVRGADTGIQVSPLAADDPNAKAVARTAIENNEVTMLPAQMPPPPQNLGTPPQPVPVPITLAPSQRAAATRINRMFGIVFGACGSVLIEGNLITSPQRILPSLGIFQFGIAGNGAFGPFAILRANDVRQFAAGAFIRQLGSVPELHQWRLITNLAINSVSKAWDVDVKFWVLENNVPAV